MPAARRDPEDDAPYPPRREQVEDLHGVTVHDPYRWLEDPADPEVIAWVARANTEVRAHTDGMPARQELDRRARELLRYDYSTVPEPCLVGERRFWRTRRADQDKAVVWRADGPDDPGRIVVDPNTWAANESLDHFVPSPTGRYAILGRARGGNEDAELLVLDVDTGEVLPDTLRGWRRNGMAWKLDESGFYYSGRPLPAERPDGGHHHFHRVWFHALGTAGEADALVLADDEVRELIHWAFVSEDGRWLLLLQQQFDRNRLWLEDLANGGPRIPIATDFDARYRPIDVLGGALLLWTDHAAPRGRVVAVDPGDPARERWREVVPEGPDRLEDVSAVGGRLYLRYSRSVSTRIAVHDLDGTWRTDVPLPTIGTATVSGRWGQPEVRVDFQSFATPPTTFGYDGEALTVLRPPQVPVDPALLARITVEQVWYRSRDDTPVPMFVLRLRDTSGPAPTLLTGYGGFDRSMEPTFLPSYLLWVERGGVVAIPSLRGGGEFGKDWHEAGRRERKQNVFDDFLAAADWLVEHGVTEPRRLAISGGSNGGLLVSAAVVQRPDRFGAVLCSVPLTDMLRFHRFKIGSLWTEEYGSPDDPVAVRYLRAYSPYHNLVEGADYPPMLVVGSANDARTDPAHARKFWAAARHADRDHGGQRPILMWERSESGHLGAVAIDARADHLARSLGFLWHHVTT